MVRSLKNQTLRVAQDPSVKQAAMKLFWASDEFRKAYAEWMLAAESESPKKLEALNAAEKTIDEARAALNDAELRVRKRLAGDGEPTFVDPSDAF